MIVAAAHVRVDDQIVGLALDGGVVERHAQLAYLLQVDRAHAGLCHEIGVAVDTPSTVIKLDIAAACCVQVGNHGAVCCRDGIGELFVGLVDGAQTLLLAIATVERDFGERLDRCRDGLACNVALALKCLDKLKVLDEGVVLSADGAGHHGGIGRGLLVVEHIARTRGTTLDAVQPPHKIEVPVAAAKLAIGDDLQAGGLLLCHQIADGIVLDGLKPLGIKRACRIGSTSVLYGLRTKKAADDISAKRRVRLNRSAHRYLPFALVALLGQSMSVHMAIVKYTFITV